MATNTTMTQLFRFFVFVLCLFATSAHAAVPDGDNAKIIAPLDKATAANANETGEILHTNIKQEERIATLEKRIAAAGDNFVSLTAEEYDLLLSQPIGSVDGFKPLATTAGGIVVGIGFREDGPKIWETNIQTIFPNIPNIGEGDVFVIFDFVKGSNGLDFLDRMSNTEIKEEKHTQLALDTRTVGSKSYWFGSRYVHLRDPEDGITIRALGALGGEVKLAAVSGKVVMRLPTNITDIVLKKEYIGSEHSFAGGSLILKKVSDDSISFQFFGDTRKIFAWNVYDVNGNSLEINDVSVENGLYQLSAQNPQSVKVYQAEIVRREYPFAFRNESHATSEEASSAPLFEGVEAARLAAMLFQLQTKNAKNAAPVYLNKTAPIFKSIKARAVTDLKQSVKRTDPESPESKLIASKVEAWSQEKQDQWQALGGNLIKDYAARTHFDAVTFIVVLSSFKEIDQKKIAETWDIRVQKLGGNKYIAEFWEDGLAVNSEPVGKPERYYQMMALLYTQEKDGSIIFHDPFQQMFDLSGSD